MKEIYSFTAPWCTSCANLKPHLEKVMELGVTVHEINVESDPKTAEEFDVMQLPTVVFLLEGAIINRKAGFSESLVVDLYNFTRS